MIRDLGWMRDKGYSVNVFLCKNADPRQVISKLSWISYKKIMHMLYSLFCNLSSSNAHKVKGKLG
jgi:hypothetical protein